MNSPEGLNYVHIRTLLVEMRKCRLGLVQAPEQLRFVYQSVIEALDSNWEAENEVSPSYISNMKKKMFQIITFTFNY